MRWMPSPGGGARAAREMYRENYSGLPIIMRVFMWAGRFSLMLAATSLAILAAMIVFGPVLGPAISGLCYFVLSMLHGFAGSRYDWETPTAFAAFGWMVKQNGERRA